MKKVLAMGLLAMALIALSQQQASAWTNNHFSFGIDWQRQSGGNCFGWGLWKNGDVPGPGMYPAPYMAGPPSPYYGAPIPPPTVYLAPYPHAAYPPSDFYYYQPPAYHHGH